MVNNGHPRNPPRSAIPDLRYVPPPGLRACVEVMTLAELRSRAQTQGKVLSDPQRPSFHQVFALDSGTLRQTVDFTERLLTPGSWLWVRPGQVQQHGDLTAGEGTLVLFEASFLDRPTATAAGLDDACGPLLWRPAPDSADAWATRLALDHLHREFAQFAAADGAKPDWHLEVLRHLLATLVLRMAGHHSAAPGDAGLSEAFLRFRTAVERDFARTRQVADYARALGYSPRTLSRATHAAAGTGAKEFIDRRVLLEAKRMLAHSDEPAAVIAGRLGFADATNFSKFFHQREGHAPGAFRAGIREV
ncbi:AraC family transcriptional regulator [Streptomyces boncukensis]|uniref:Helix-turn-helix transcriptional regulator n=1 Tax=Streptomyces boncukensis TaxID=2711219 RepID=A0A6G4WYM6_9ACTN|nr:AraC family transcriptional regulator [Streptomyces boncukensis]NGO70218.1 helix-turn-helix transcriptional regulator [Streptomyces boncukensis]